eukprot:TRINITY_DN1629_c0_g1_i1.p1 TRINITY_DN1629_c0_g1~~TRINITY_DN1629_c0_g1_i1.p1  ORF type:complete len:462 (+),score=99.31 TRINITY_DN1629_c0_g1_i1:39-1424(+)
MMRWVLGLLVCLLVEGQVFPDNYKPQAQLLINTALNSYNWSNYEYFCDTFGPRYRGTPGLDGALDWIANTMLSQGLLVTKEPVTNIPNWVRGQESLELLQPRRAKLSILGFGNSVGGKITAEAIVVSSFDDLKKNADKAKGKIVIYNVPFTTYGETVMYRVAGATEAAKVGGVAALVRTVGSFSLYTPHTGVMHYDPAFPKVPTAAITIEDSEMLARMYQRGQVISMSLSMDATMGPAVSSYNILAEIKGRESPDEVVVLGGHSDSWDVGQGAIDDGGGLYTAWEAVRIINTLIQQGQLQRPRRTIRLVLWVDEEIAQTGARTYYNDFLEDLPNHVIAMESDSGNFDLVGFGFTGLPEAKAIMLQIATLLNPLNAGNITDGAGADTDNGFLVEAGVPGGSLESTGFEGPGYYFWFHHSNADMITHINRDGFMKSSAGFAIVSYVLADMEQRLPSKLKPNRT